MNPMITRSPGEIVFACLLLLTSSWLFWQAYAIAQFTSLSSPGALPLAASMVMVISAAMTLMKTIKLPLDPDLRFFRHLFPPVVGIVIAMILMFAIMLEPIGFIISAGTFLFLGMTFLQRSSLKVSIGLTILCLVTVYCVFRLVFQVVLPEGVVPEREWLALAEKLFK